MKVSEIDEQEERKNEVIRGVIKAIKGSNPLHIGTWVIGTNDLHDIVHWGEDGDTKHPYPPDDTEALAQAQYLFESGHEGVIYLLHVFTNGQMKMFEFDPKEES